MGCGTSKEIHPPQRVGENGEFAGRSVARKASSINRRGQSRKKSMKMNAHKVQATLGGESFYVMEACYRQVPGVITVKSGHCPHMGINLETVQISFDSNKISYTNLLKVHLKMHNPTAPFKEDSKIKSIIFTHNAEQAQQAKAELDSYQKQNPVTLRTIVTEFSSFMPDNQAANYYTNNFNSEKAQKEIKPKLDAFKTKLATMGMQSVGLPNI